MPDDDGAPLSDSQATIDGHIGVTPLSVFPELHRRPLEPEVGYTFQVFTDALRQNRNRHGFYGGLSVHLGDYWLGEGWRARVTVRGFAEYIVLQAHPGEGGGATWALGFEVARFIDESNDSPSGISYFGLAIGELSLGAELYGGYHIVESGTARAEYGTIGAAITVRWPGPPRRPPAPTDRLVLGTRVTGILRWSL